MRLHWLAITLAMTVACVCADAPWLAAQDATDTNVATDGDANPEDSDKSPADAPVPSESDEDTSELPSDGDVESTQDESEARSQGLADHRDVKSFLDGFLSAQLAHRHVAGATVSVVSGDHIIFSQGYGSADLENSIDVDPAKTMFRIGSVSKLFIWTAIMQLVEQGKIDLDEDVNTYLAESGIQVPKTFDQPITMKDLMCHTPGFEDYVIGLFGRDHESLMPISELMKQQMPRRVRPPGDLASYSNHGSLLAAVVIEQVSGNTWEDFVSEQILTPLDMVNTSLDQPQEDQLPESLSQGYEYDSGANEFAAEDFEYIPAAPAGCINASADDMAHFMIAHVNGGQYKTNRILKPETTKLMHSRARWHDERLDAMCHGFWELHRNGVRILEHGGDTNLFHSLMMILPKEKVGLFVSYNTDTAGPLRDELRNAFLDRYFPVEQVNQEPPEGFSGRAKRFTGSYKMLRYDHSTLAKLSMVVQVLPVAVRDDDRLSIGGKSYIEVEPLKFEEENGPETVVFREDGDGEITHLFINRAPAIALQKMKWYESPYLHIGLFAASAFMFLTTIIGWPLLHLVTKGQLIAGQPPTRTSRLASWIGWFVAVAFVVFAAVLVLQAEEIVHGIPPALDLLLRSTPILAILAGLLAFLAGLSWMRRYWRITGRIHFLLLAIAAVGTVWQLAFFNMLPVSL